MNDFPFPQEFDGIAHIRIIREAEDVVISHPGFLLCAHILVEVGNGIPCHRECVGVERCARGRHRIDACGVIDKIIIEAGRLDLVRGHVSGKLIDDGSHHFQMGQLFRTNIRQNCF